MYLTLLCTLSFGPPGTMIGQIQVSMDEHRYSIALDPWALLPVRPHY
jgi:hypothetical protein